ncbi:peptide chain release factor N(5)-glutamine methyltransferase [Piscibacillus halophilus]|uniref:Release factor glutamine methyltransferase n=1 Tax=Piscibacillus halophilus TaxID=571933 RepID=A0A1H9JY86_9BACI|nr:peptide chain release factor N(5)-glutamine methyltransferase [Piscibacillus halophilus]SEQ91961.1 release factor glutamine methyltransferase [Piscibacillus halophilus]
MVQEARKWASSFLEKYHREPRVADLMLQHLLNVDLADFLLIQRDEINAELLETFESWVQEHAETGKPLEHFLGVASFYGREFSVNQHVLIPRPETEELIETVKPLIKPSDVVVDVGTGSGIIAITLKKEMPDVQMLATDISLEALAVAQKNAEKLDADVQFEQGNFLKPLIDSEVTVDVVVSNPPYIPKSESGELSEVVMHDPDLALFANDQGLAAYRDIIEQISYLKTLPRLVAFEIGYDQGATVPELIRKAHPNAVIQVLQDINGKDRIVIWKN